MTSRLSYEEIRRLARTWFDEARIKSERDEAEVVAWKKQRPFSGSLDGSWWFSGSHSGNSNGSDGGSCDGGGGE